MNCCCKDEKRIIIVRGNDTNFNGQNFVHLNITSDVWDLSTMKATIALGGITKTFTDLSNGIDLSYTATETSKLQIGNVDGVLNVYNQEEQVATIESLIPFRVISIVHGNAIAVTPSEFNIEVKQGEETVMNIDVEAGVSVEVGSTTTLPAGSDATVTNSGTGSHLVLDFGIPKGDKGDKGEQGEQGEPGEQGVPGKDGADGKNATINGVNTLTLTATDGLNLAQSGNVATLSGKSIQDSVTNEATNRSNADNNLQQQIDAIAASSDVTDIVGTHADLENYDTSKLKDNDIIKVLQDETEGGATTYYRWSTHTDTFTLIGEEGPYYTKGDADEKFVPQTRTINNKALDQNITLDASDVGAATAAQGAKADTALQGATVNGTSVVTDGVAVIPLAAASGGYGLVKLSDANTGLTISNSGNLVVSPASNLNIDGKANAYKPIVPSNLDYAVKRGVAYNSQTLTDAEKTAANVWLGSVKDATVDGTSIVNGTTKVAEIPIAQQSGDYGLVKLNSNAYGITKDGTNGFLYLQSATEADINTKNNQHRPIVPKTLDYATKRGLAYNSLTLTDAEKASACSWLGAEKTPNTATITSGTSFECTDNTIFDGGSSDIAAVTCTLPSTIPTDYWVQINFASGSTATTFTYDSSIKWVDGCDDVQFISNVRKFVPVANKRYTVMFISDGTNVIATAKGV